MGQTSQSLRWPGLRGRESDGCTGAVRSASITVNFLLKCEAVDYVVAVRRRSQADLNVVLLLSGGWSVEVQNVFCRGLSSPSVLLVRSRSRLVERIELGVVKGESAAWRNAGRRVLGGAGLPDRIDQGRYTHANACHSGNRTNGA